MYTRNEKIIPINIEKEMKDSYINYAMSVIVGRALPDVRDGLKPVHRRILFAMNELNLQHSKPYKKSARIVGETLGKYHPHGDVAVYESLVRMVQTFSMRYPLIDGQGNFGSVDGDSAAAMRYTEARFHTIAELMLADIDRDTVDFIPNFDESLQEPLVLPAKIPNLLINGSSGIAVGMATNIPPHNLSEIVDGVIAVIDNPDITAKELMKIIKGPDFPTGGIIRGLSGIRSMFKNGRGILKMYARASIEQQKNNREAIIITEIPYQVNKATLIENIANLVNDKRLEGISNIRDESDKDGLRIVVDLKRDANAQIVLNQLYKNTQMEDSFGVIMLALVDGHPKVLNMKQMLEEYIRHRKEVTIRRIKYELAHAQERAHILEGLRIAVHNLDDVIKIIRKSPSQAEAKTALIAKFDLSQRQAQAILEMPLGKLTGLEIDKLEKEYLELIKTIEMYQSILKSDKKIMDIIKEELVVIRKKYGDERRTEILAEEQDMDIEDLIAEEDVVITVTHGGYIKRLPVSAYRKQKRGGKGVTGMETKEEDFVEDLFVASTHDYMLFFTNVGRVYWLKAHEIPQAGRVTKGKAIVNLLQLSSNEKIQTMINVSSFEKEKNLIMVTKQGVIKKTALEAYSNPRKGGIVAINLDKDDELISVKVTNGQEEIVLATKLGKAIRFPETQIRAMGRTAHGIRGIRLAKGDETIGMEIVKDATTLLTVAQKGFGKRSDFAEYRKQSRGGKGVINLKVTDKNGAVVSIMSVKDTDELMVITQEGMIVRMALKDIRVIGRSTQGVRIISLNGDDKVMSIAKVVAKEDE